MLRHKLKSARNYLRQSVTPTWVKYPENIQIDTQNYCNLWMEGKGCIHCNVKPSGGWNLPRGKMPTEMIRYIIDYWGEHGSKSVAPYINGEPLLDERLPWLIQYCEEHGMFVLVDTNGTLHERKEMLIHPNLREVRFSFSATTPNVYEQVHGCPYFDRAKQTINWFLKHKHPSQICRLYFITNRYNMHQLTEYIQEWHNKAWITLFPLHEVPHIQTESTKTRPTAEQYWNQITKQLTGKVPHQPYRPIDIRIGDNARTRYLHPWVTCQGTHSFSIAWTGELLHCTDIPYRFNYGHVYEHDMLKVWHQRNRAKLGHPACSVCNVRHPNHDNILKRYLH